MLRPNLIVWFQFKTEDVELHFKYVKGTTKLLFMKDMDSMPISVFVLHRLKQLGDYLNNDSLLKLNKCNYGFYKYPVLTFSGSYTQKDYDITISNTNGHPIFLNICGDINPLDTSASSQLNIIICKNGNMITRQIVESHNNSQNIPFSLNYLDIVPKGTYKYTFSLLRGNGHFILGENGNQQSSQCMAFEI